ncbi:MAG: hypothetical protein LBC10_02970 [Deltaproteobacteria bacterium]|jgi:pentatricopeptide repeat protein|nr:hypothetical protein [Deltaproteobacteria bacterium]
MTQLTAPAAVSQNVARAKSLINRKEPLRAVNCLISALENFTPRSLVGKARYEVEVHIRQCITDLNLNPKVRQLLTDLTRSPNSNIPYAPGAEANLLTVLNVLRKALENMETDEKAGVQHALEDRKVSLLESGKNLLAAGEGLKAKVELRRLATEFGKEPGILTQIGTMLMQADMLLDAAEFLELAIETFPREGQIYSTLVDCYMGAREYEKVEAVYLKVLKQFGSHPRTLLNLAKLYKLMNKRQKAMEMAQRALAQEPDNAEAKEIANAFR